MKRIPLTQGQFALVDDEDFNWLSSHTWFAVWKPHTHSFYAARQPPRGRGKRRLVYMHREIMGAKRGEKVDHKFHDTLDNRKEKLRICTHQQNMANYRVPSTNTSGFKGVSWHKGHKKWQAAVRDGHGNKLHLGYFSTAESAARSYKAEAVRINGEFAVPDCSARGSSR